MKVSSACETTTILTPEIALTPGGVEYWHGPSSDYLVREFDWVSDSYSKTVMDDHNRPMATHHFFCGERVYELEMKAFSRTKPVSIYLPGFYTGIIDPETGKEILEHSKA